MPVACQTHDLWKALMKYKQFQVGHSIKLLMGSFHCLETGWLLTRILIPCGRKLQVELCGNYEFQKETCIQVCLYAAHVCYYPSQSRTLKNWIHDATPPGCHIAVCAETRAIDSAYRVHLSALPDPASSPVCI